MRELEPGQVREEAALSAHSQVPRFGLARASDVGSSRGDRNEGAHARPGTSPTMAGQPTTLRRRQPRWVFSPRLRWDLTGPVPADEVRARLNASPRFRGEVEPDGRIGLVFGGPLLAVGPELRGAVTKRTGGSILTLEARLAAPVAMAATVWVAGLVVAAIALAGLLAFGAILLLAAGVLGAIVVGLVYQLAARSCLDELQRLAEAELVRRPDFRR